jgi:N-acetylglucosaminyldiphosphoundecaprenol N-acetyl-beta-D-mannosaminyltransferase
MNSIRVGPFQIIDEPASSICRRIVESAGTRTAVLALHIGGLNHRHDTAYLAALRRAELVYADSISVVALARIAGARHVQRTPTTDLGWQVIDGLSERLGRPVRLGIIGSDPETLALATARFEASGDVKVVHATDGYRDSYAGPVADLRDAGPDLVLVGLGMPREARWIADHFEQLPDAIIMSCGGWLGFVAGREKRAPRWMQRSGMEWMKRVSQSPRRLLPRYALGVLTVLALTVPQAMRRFREVRLP